MACDAVVVCTGAYTAKFLRSTIGVYSALAPVKSYTFDMPTKSDFSKTQLLF